MEELSRKIEELTAEKRELLELLVKEEGSEFNSFGLSYAQQRLWFLEQLEGPSCLYNVGSCVRVRGELKVEALEASFKEIVRRHETLRTRFTTIQGQAVQVIEAGMELEIAKKELWKGEGEERKEELEEEIREEVEEAFNLEEGPLLRVKLIKVGEREHVLVMTMHHIVSDGWSMGVMIREVASLYEGYTKGEGSGLEEMGIQYVDYAQWQREWLVGEVLEEQVEYWKKQLEGAPGVMELPIDKRREAINRHKGSKEGVRIGRELTRRLKEIGEEEEATLYMVLLAGFKVLVMRYTGEEDVVVGTAIAGRNRGEVEGLIGFFINTLVMRTDMRGEPSFREAVRRVKEVALAGYAHQDLPFEKLVEEIQPERELSRTPLFQIYFVYQNVPSEKVEVGGVEMEAIDVSTRTSKYDMTLMLDEREGEIVGAIEYNTGLYEAETIRRMIEHYVRILEGVAKEPGKAITRIEMQTVEERHEQEVEWNDTAREYEGLLIHEFIERQGRERGEETAVIYGEERMSYGELNRRANQLGRYLRKLGAGPEKLIGVYLERGLEMIVGLLGILKSGGAYVPLEPTYPEKRVRYMVEEAGIEVVVTVDKYRERGWGEEVRVVRLDGEKEMIGKESEEEERGEVRGKNLAYVMYTSGSTGKPKAAMNTHEGISNRLQWMQEEYRLEGTDVVMQKTPYSFDVSVWELFWPLMYGARLVIAKPEGHKDSGYLVELIKKEEVTTIHFVPAMLRTFLEEEGVKECASLRRVISSGEALGVEEVEKVRERLGVELYNLYGPTEAAVDVTWWKCGEEGGSSVPIGRPISNMEVRILDGRGEMVAVGVTGELYISGVGVGRGYLKGEEQTAERYVPDGYGGKEGGRQYRTGDLARWRRDGSVEYVGRKDEQVKVRGYRIELGEIEAVLSQHEGVREAVVVVKEEERSKRLVGYVVERGEGAREEELREYLKDRLPEYMVPWVIEKVEEMPVTANGKVDRKRLEQREVERGGKEEGYRGPRTGAEEVLAAVWEQVLKVERVGIDENFFELGGDSIRSIQVVAMAKERGVEVSLQELFQHQTIAELAGEIRRGGGEGGERRGEERIRTEAKSLIREEDRAGIGEEIEDAYPLTKLQAGMMYHMELTPETPVYHNVDSMRLKMKWEGKEFEEAVEEVVKRHAVMRTSFEMSKYSEPLQMVHREAKVEIGVSDIREKSEEEQEEEIEEFIKREGKRRFDYRKAPLIRFYIHKRSEEEIQFTITESHTINDGWSLHSTLAEIFEYYFALIKGEEPAKGEELKVSFRDYVAMERAAVESEECQQYWAEKLADCTFMEMPRTGGRIERKGPRVITKRLDIPVEVSDSLKALAREVAVPIKSVLLAAHLRVMSLLSGQTDVVTGVVTNGRPEEEGGERVRGLFLNTIPFREQLPGGTWEELVREVFETEREILPYRRYPLAAIQKRWGKTRLFETSFNFIQFHVVDSLLGSGEVELIGYKKWEETNLTMHAHFNLGLLIPNVGLELDFNMDRLTEQQVETITACYLKVLTAMASDPMGRYELQSFIPAHEEQQILMEWNKTAKAFEATRLVHQFFEAQVERTPHAVAVVFEESPLTYDELNRRANKLAHYLREMGAGPGSLVGICVERSLDIVVGVMGILKAGAAYVPLDPAYPKARLAFMLEDAKSRVLVTQQHLISSFPEDGPVLVCLDRDSEIIAERDEKNPVSLGTINDLAYVIYTSGSTGRPKGVLIEHEQLVNYVLDMIERLGAAPGASFAWVQPLTVDSSKTAIYPPLFTGGMLHVISHERATDARRLGEYFVRHKMDYLKIAPSHLAALQKSDRPESLLPKECLVVGGETSHWDFVDGLVNLTPYCRIMNHYGPTEATVGVLTYTLDKEERIHNTAAVPLGRPISNTRIYILNSNLQPVPVGVPGEIYIGGDCLARGYLNLPVLTAEKFVADAFSRTPGKRLYRTGDLARYLYDGNIEFLGRIDHQVKIRGFRVELGEIEAAVSQYPSVREVVVMAHDDLGNDARLVGYVVGDGGTPLLPADLRSFLREKLPEYMIPAVFVMLDALPLTPHGKIDRRRIPMPDCVMPESERNYVAPRTEMEKVLCDVWAQVLGAGQVGIADNFFELGGDSILAIQVTSRARTLGVRITANQIFQKPTIAELGPVVDTIIATESEQGIITGPVPLTPIQRWFLERSFANLHQFSQAAVLEFRDRVDADALANAVQRLFAQHDALRLRFTLGENGWLQFMGDGELALLSTVDLSALSALDQRLAVELSAAELQFSLNISSGPLARFALFDSGESGTSLLLMMVHHLAIDGVSWRVILEDIQVTYQQALAGVPFVLPPKSTSFKRWAESLVEYAKSEALKQELKYWLREVPAIKQLPVDYASGTDVNTLASTRGVSVSLDKEATAALLQNVPAAYNTQINDALLASLARAFEEWTGQRSLLVAMEGHGREEEIADLDVSRTVGWFTTHAPILIDLENCSGDADILKSVKEQLRAIPNRGIGYGLLRYLSGDEEITGRLESMPEPEVVFNYLGQFDQVINESSPFCAVSEPVTSPVSVETKRPYLLEVSGGISGGQLQMVFNYSENVHQRPTIERLANRFLDSLQAIIAHCKSPEAGGYTPSDFPLAGMTQKQLDTFVYAERRVEDIYPLSPVQQGMLYHTLYAPESGIYFQQLSCTLNGQINVPAFKQALQRVVDRHGVLRTGFVWDGLEHPVQIVRRSVALPFEQLDWHEFSPAEQQLRLDQYLKQDRERGFELSKAPLMRVGLIELAEDRFQFVWSHHHLLMDGWSRAAVLNEVFAFYDALCLGSQLSLDKGGSYRDYIAWILGQDTSKAQAFWREMLSGVSEPSRIRLEPSSGEWVGEEGRFETRQMRLSHETTAALQSLARQRQLTLNTIVQGAWSLLLARYSGEDSVIFGTTVSGRSADLAGVEAIVGLFINTLPMRVHILQNASVLQWLREIQSKQVELRQYEHSPLIDVQGWSDVPRGLPLFESILIFENYPVDESLQEPRRDLSIERINFFEKTNYPLSIEISPGHEMTLVVSYDRSRLDDSAISRMLEYYKTLLESIVDGIDERICDLPVLTKPERHQLIDEWNSTEIEWEETGCISHLFERQVELTPDAVALTFGDEKVSYFELNRRSNQLAHQLLSMGVEAESLVGVWIERSVEMVVALLAVLKAGAAYVPLDPAYPKDRLAFMLEDSSVSVLLIKQRFMEALPVHSARIITIDSDWNQIVANSDKNPAVFVNLDNPAYVLYTSGSTGKPKAVIGTQGAAINRFKWMWAAYPFEQGEVCSQKTSLNFVDSIWEIFGPLLRGVPLVIIPDEAVEDPRLMIEMLAAQKVSRIVLVPSMLRAFLTESEDIQRELPNLKYWTISGEALPSDLCVLFKSRMPESILLNLYGSSEVSGDSTCYVEGSREPSASTPIGRPIANTQVYLLDSSLRPVPMGVPGELFVGGKGLARGYLNLVAFTAERFIPDPFSSVEGARLYRTGDFGRYQPDGNIEYVGRVDNQVKMRGFRIELEEVEAALRANPALDEVVVALQESGGDKRLIAYVASTAAQAPTTKELRSFLSETLPDYMIPSSYVILDHISLTPNGKIDRHALAMLEGSTPKLDSEFVRARNEIEEELATIWADVIGVEEVGINDNFFYLGGHSLLATTVVSRVRKAFDVEVDLRNLFQEPTVAAMAVRIEEARNNHRRFVVPSLQRARREGPLPLSYAQERLWFLSELEPNSAFYNVPAAVRLTGELNVGALRESVNEIVRRHESLRTTFGEVDRKPTQVIGETLEVLVGMIDISEMGDEREGETERIANEEARRAFDLKRGPLLRASLVKIGEQEHASLITMHHIVSDAWSMGVLVKELMRLYEAYSEGKESPLEELAIQYADYAVWEREWLKGERLEEELGYWKKQLRGAAPVLNLGGDNERPKEQSHRGGTKYFEVEGEVMERLKELSRSEEATLFMTLLGAYKVLLSHYSGEQEIVVGIPIAGRNREEVEGLIGFFVNTLGLRTDLSGEPSFREVVRRVKEVALGAYAHQDVPLAKIVEELNPERNLGYSPIFQVCFYLGNAPMPTLKLPNLTLSPLDAGSGTAQFDLVLGLTEMEQGAIGTLQYSTDLFKPKTADRMINQMQALLYEVATNPETTVSALKEFLSQIDRKEETVEKKKLEEAELQKLGRIKRKVISRALSEVKN